MKSLLFILSSLFFSMPLWAGIGGSGGGAVDSVIGADGYEHYTTEVCQTDEAGIPHGCRMITFKRKPNPTNVSQAPLICNGEAQNTICDNPNAHVPELLKKINKWFTDRGYETPKKPDDGAN